MVTAVTAAFEAITPDKIDEYTKYWDGIYPKNTKEYFQRWLFAFCSVHTGWRSNVAGFEAIRDFHPDIWPAALLLERLRTSGVGMHNNRSNYIWNFGVDFWKNPRRFMPKLKEPVYYLRNRLVPAIKGLGWAKVSFALEMCWPLEADLVCLDVHMLRLFGHDQTKVNPNTYKALEHDWVGRSQDRGVAPYIARMIYWDRLQKRDSSHYWSHVLERTNDLQTDDADNDGQVGGGLPGEVSPPPDDSGHEFS